MNEGIYSLEIIEFYKKIASLVEKRNNKFALFEKSLISFEEIK